MIFSVNDRQSIQYIRLNLNLPNVEVVIESRKKKFIDKLSLVDSFSVVVGAFGNSLFYVM